MGEQLWLFLEKGQQKYNFNSSLSFIFHTACGPNIDTNAWISDTNYILI